MVYPCDPPCRKVTKAKQTSRSNERRRRGRERVGRIASEAAKPFPSSRELIASVIAFASEREKGRPCSLRTRSRSSEFTSISRLLFQCCLCSRARVERLLFARASQRGVFYPANFCSLRKDSCNHGKAQAFQLVQADRATSNYRTEPAIRAEERGSRSAPSKTSEAKQRRLTESKPFKLQAVAAEPSNHPPPIHSEVLRR